VDAGALSLIVLCLFYLIINYLMGAVSRDWMREFGWSAIIVAITVVGVVWIQARGGSSQSPWASWTETLLPIGFFVLFLVFRHRGSFRIAPTGMSPPTPSPLRDDENS
jgi:hypothetical protein